MIRIIIIDDEQKSIDVLKYSLSKIRNDIQIVGEAHSADSGLKLIEQVGHQTDLLFLDIQMPNGDGFHLLNSLKKIPFGVIFVTAFDQFAIKAIRFSALDYLLKPVNTEELESALQRFEQKQNGSAIQAFSESIRNKTLFDKLAISTLTEVRLIPIEQIRYFESENSYCTLYLDTDERVVSTKSIGYYETLLQDHSFFRCHNSYLINIKKVTRFLKGDSRLVELENRIRLDVSERRKNDLLALLGLM